MHGPWAATFHAQILARPGVRVKHVRSTWWVDPDLLGSRVLRGALVAGLGGLRACHPVAMVSRGTAAVAPCIYTQMAVTSRPSLLLLTLAPCVLLTSPQPLRGAEAQHRSTSSTVRSAPSGRGYGEKLCSQAGRSWLE